MAAFAKNLQHFPRHLTEVCRLRLTFGLLRELRWHEWSLLNWQNQVAFEAAQQICYLSQRPRDPVLMPLHTSHYKRFQAWPLAALNWKPAQLSLTSLHPLQGSQPTNKRVGCNHQATKIDVCFSSCRRNKSSHENWDILEMLLVSFRYERSLSHSPNSKPASIDVSKHGAKRISRNRSIYI